MTDPLYQPFPMGGVARAQIWRHAPRYRRPRHFHPEPELNLVVAGSATFAAGESELAVSAGDLLWWAPGQDHGLLACSSDLDLFVIGASPELSDRLLGADAQFTLGGPTRLALSFADLVRFRDSGGIHQFVFHALKRALSRREIRIESISDMYGLASTVGFLSRTGQAHQRIPLNRVKSTILQVWKLQQISEIDGDEKIVAVGVQDARSFRIKVRHSYHMEEFIFLAGRHQGLQDGHPLPARAHNGKIIFGFKRTHEKTPGEGPNRLSYHSEHLIDSKPFCSLF